MNSFYKFLILATAFTLVGCLDSFDKNPESVKEPTTNSVPVAMGSVSIDRVCDSSKEG